MDKYLGLTTFLLAFWDLKFSAAAISYNVSAAKIFQIVEEVDNYPACDKLEITRGKTKTECALICSRQGKKSIFNSKNSVCHCSTKSCKQEESTVLLVERTVQEYTPEVVPTTTTPQPTTTPSPITSCKKIKDGNPLAASGMYSLDLPTPTEVYCDMTTDGGGWIRIGRVHTATDADVSSYSFNGIFSTDLLQLYKAESENFLLSGSAFPTLQSYVDFHEFRVYCTKTWHGRTNHASFSDQTTAESKKFFDYVMGTSSTSVNTCDALKYMPDDNSVVQSTGCTSSKISVKNDVSVRLYYFLWYIGSKTHVYLGANVWNVMIIFTIRSDIIILELGIFMFVNDGSF